MFSRTGRFCYFGALVAATSVFATSSPGPVGNSRPDVQEPASQQRPGRAAATQDEASYAQNDWADKLRRGTAGAKLDNDPFSSRTWVAPPKAAPVAAPSVPPFPFRFLGKMLQQGGPPTLFLERADRLYAVTQGQVLDGNYRLDAIGETEVDLTYLPLDRKQRIAYSEIVAPPPPGYTHATAPLSPAAGRPDGLDVIGRQPGGLVPSIAGTPAPPPASGPERGSTALRSPAPAPNVAQAPGYGAQITPHGPVPLHLMPDPPAPARQTPFDPAPAGATAPLTPWTVVQPRAATPK